MNTYSDKDVDNLPNTIAVLTEQLESTKLDLEECYILIQDLESTVKDKDDRICILETGIDQARDSLFDLISTRN